MRRIIVTGGAGFVGVPTVARLLALGNDVTVVDNFVNGSRSHLEDVVGLDIPVLDVDLRDSQALTNAFTDVHPDVVVHLAALHFIPYCNLHRAETIAINVLGTQHVLEAAAASDVNRVVFVSTADVYQPSETPHSEDAPIETNNIYGMSKLAGEQLVRMWGADDRDRQWSIVRLFNVIGPGETNPHVIPDICKALATSDVLSLGNTTPRRDYVFVEDVADVLAHLIDVEQPDVVVNLGTGRSWSVTDLVERMAALTGRNLTIETDAAKVRPTDRPRLEADVSRLRALFPWATKTTLDDSIRVVLAEHQLD